MHASLWCFHVCLFVKAADIYSKWRNPTLSCVCNKQTLAQNAEVPWHKRKIWTHERSNSSVTELCAGRCRFLVRFLNRNTDFKKKKLQTGYTRYKTWLLMMMIPPSSTGLLNWACTLPWHLTLYIKFCSGTLKNTKAPEKMWHSGHS